MAGASVRVETKGLPELNKALQHLLEQGQDMSAVYQEIGEYLLQTHQQRFIDQQAPDGTPWEPLSSTTIERKTRTDRVLTEEGTLADTLHYQLNQAGLDFGSNQEYAAIHQFGGTTSPFSMFSNQDIPARPFIGIASFEQDYIIDLVESHLVHALA
ncbi:phage virion morphogenesis protein [Shewanella glacialimarina]|uniref:phage virion morphogenesis protein n=1 Tax=Shewanella glacialimarina TaxID=2590884 RepID=UPI001CF8A275|nr:phage virion morphogenesis protein [Shewanella glacialimarina]UCX05432.1 phage virion morphogenesis protein [Shewanella glacialimarina]